MVPPTWRTQNPSAAKPQRFERRADRQLEGRRIAAAGRRAERVDRVLRLPRQLGPRIGQIVGGVVEPEAPVGILDDLRLLPARDALLDVGLERGVNVLAPLAFGPQIALNRLGEQLVDAARLAVGEQA
jgi:hypothetical protein